MTRRLINYCVETLALLLLLSNYCHTASLPFFGPVTYTRSTGSPETIVETFPICNLASTYKIIIENGAAGDNRVSAASIFLNGDEIVKENEFSQKISLIEKQVKLKTENTLTVRLASKPGSFITVRIVCAESCPAIGIDVPQNNDTINKTQAVVRGFLVNMPQETGVTLVSSGTEGSVRQLAQNQGGIFAGAIPLQTGANTIIATATDACGYKLSDTAVIQSTPVESPVRLTVTPSSGILNKTTGSFDVALEAEIYLANSIAKYSWDFNADGIAEQEGSNIAKVIAKYTAPGLYFPALTIIDDQGKTYSETAIVHVIAVEQMDVILKGKWLGMKNAMTTKDVAKAITFFAESSQAKYGNILTILKESLPEIAANMKEINMDYVKADIAEYRIVRAEDIDGQKQDITYFIYFIKDRNGLWKIASF